MPHAPHPTAAARIQPRREGYYNAIQVYPWSEGALYQVYAAVGQITDIALEPGESLTGAGPIAAGDTAATFAVGVWGDKRVEADETVLVRLSAPVAVTLADSEAVGTITDDDLPVLSVTDTTLAEGDSLGATLGFRVQLSAAPRTPVTFHYETLDGTARLAEGQNIDTFYKFLPSYYNKYIIRNTKLSLNICCYSNIYIQL